MNIDGIFNNLRQKLDVLGYTQPLPLSALSLVSSIFEDLVKTTESLRDAKKKISELLEEKSCWELGVEPYKCDNSRLINEVNQLNIDLIKQREKFEETLCDYAKKIRNLETDKNYLEEHCAELENQVRELVIKYSDTKVLKNKKDGTNMIKRPAFITTVRSGVFLPNPPFNPHQQRKCAKCNRTLFKRLIIDGGSPREQEAYGPPEPQEIERLQNYLKDRSDEVSLFKNKVEARDREIKRLNELLQGGRPAAALARDCCYRNIGPLKEDLDLLQREKNEIQGKLYECESDMHEAKQRALDLIEQNKILEKELEELKNTALSLEKEANEEINEKEQEIEKLYLEIQKIKKTLRPGHLEDSNLLEYDDTMAGSKNCNLDEKRKLHERLNELTAREREMSYEIERMHKKNEKLKYKLMAMHKGNEDKSECNHKFMEDERARLKSERDFFHKEYLSLIHKAGSEKELEFLQTQIKSKDEELRNLRAELMDFKQHQQNPPNAPYHQQSQMYHDHHHHHPMEPHSYRDRQFPPRPCSSSTTASNHYPHTVQAAIIRAERERDVVKAELERIKLERDSLRERLQCLTETQYKESQRLKDEIDELNNKILCLEREKREIETAQIPGQTHIVLMKEEIETLKKRVYELQNENSKLKTSYNQIKILQDQTEKALVDVQNKYAVAETQLENAEARLTSFDTNRTTTRNELDALKNEIFALKSINSTIENEKDKIITELDAKTEKIYKLESELKSLTRRNKDLDSTGQEFQQKYEKLLTERKSRENELDEAGYESKSLRTQVTTLKASLEQTIAENSRLSSELADSKAETLSTKSKLKESEKEVESLRKQLQQYVSEVKKAEELLMAKEREREEMLEHYRCLSHDAVVLEGNNQSLEIETADQKRQLSEAEAEIEILKKEISRKNAVIEKLERQVSSLSAQVASLERELEQAYDDQHLLKVDLDAMKELCEKLDLQRDKLNAELEELGAMRTKLEQENEKLRRLNGGAGVSQQAASDTLEKLLDKTRDELDDTRRSQIKLTQEIKKLKDKNDDLELKLKEEKEKLLQKEAQAKEYSVQVQELRNNITDDRFKRAQSREESPRDLTSS
ncbi:centrosomal protein of 135 kDa [Condylostylus longicornis]|uniref:centrosomal protein of 135 kDa n=1 Tax=Condylostylus longicornis TaxID=2530218 RepID=UPI00244E0262|nr:centrosomal protein of 135 kDa [Condylostylus longicornis]